LMFKHLRAAVAFAEDDPAIFQRIGRARSEHHDARAALAIEPIEHPPKRFRLNERRIAVEDQDRSVVSRERALGLLDRVRSAELLRLMGYDHVAAVERKFNLV